MFIKGAQKISTSDATKPVSAVDDGQAQQGKHIVDTLIEERAEKLRHSRLWPLYRAILYPLLLHGRAVEMADSIRNLPGQSVFETISGLLSLRLDVTGLDHVPESGRILIAPNHPTGIPDGVAIYDALKDRRPDMTFFANRDAIRVAPQLEDMIIPVEWVPEKRTRMRSRETLISASKAFKDEKCIVLFPSGALSYMNEKKELVEQKWLASVATFARKYECAVIPTRITMRNSGLYYLFWKLNTELRDITLFHELLNKKNKLYKIVFGAPIAASALKGDPALVASALRHHVEHNVLVNRPWSPIDTQ